MNPLTRQLLDLGLAHLIRSPSLRSVGRLGLDYVQQKLDAEHALTAPHGPIVADDGVLAELAQRGIPVLQDRAASAFWRSLRETEFGTYLVLGRKGSGKTALSLLLAELHSKPLLVIGLDQALLDRLPIDAEEIPPAALIHDLPSNVTMLVDDAVLFFSNYQYNSPVAARIREIIALQRHFHHHLIFNSQLGASLNRYVVEPTVLFLKPASMLFADLERPHLRKRFENAQRAFSLVDVALWPRYVYALTDQHEGMLETELPTGWSSALSRNKGVSRD